MAPRPVTGHQGGARRVLEHSSLKAGSAVSPAGRYLVQIRHGRLSSSDKRRPGGRQEGTARDRQGSAGSAQGGDASSRGLAGHGMPARRMAGRATIDCAIGRTTRRGGQAARGLGAAVADRRDPSAAGGARRRQGLAYFFFIMSKNSALVLVTRILSRMNSMDCTSSMSWMNLRSTQTFCSRSGAISSSSRRVPDLFRLMAG